MTPVSIVCAFFDSGCPHRRAAVEYVIPYWKSVFPSAQVLMVSASRPTGLNAAIRDAPDGIIVQVDPDSFVAPEQAQSAIKLASESDGLVVPFDNYCYLTRESTAAYLEGGAILDRDTPCDEAGVDGVGNCGIFTRRTWELAGGFDERFGSRMWGGDDAAFAYCCVVFVGPVRRVRGPMWHLWHPRQPDSVVGSSGYLEQFALVAQYRDGTPQEIRELVEARGRYT